jgi:hypothetical protein
MLLSNLLCFFKKKIEKKREGKMKKLDQERINFETKFY